MRRGTLACIVLVRARTSPIDMPRHRSLARASHGTFTILTPSPTGMKHAAHVTGTSFPFSSSYGAAWPTGTTFQFSLVGVPGGGRVRVCQGAPVRDLISGRCWVMSWFCARRPMANMAAAQGRRGQCGAMVVRDGAMGNVGTDTVVAQPAARVMTPVHKNPDLSTLHIESVPFHASISHGTLRTAPSIVVTTPGPTHALTACTTALVPSHSAHPRGGLGILDVATAAGTEGWSAGGSVRAVRDRGAGHRLPSPCTSCIRPARYAAAAAAEPGACLRRCAAGGLSSRATRRRWTTAAAPRRT